MFTRPSLIGDTIIIVCVGFSASVLGSFIVTNGRSEMSMVPPIMAAAMCNAVVFVPSVVLRNWEFLGANRYLASIAWRVPASLGSLMMILCWDGVQRKCFVAALLTCYFITLPLESWLQIRQIKGASGS